MVASSIARPLGSLNDKAVDAVNSDVNERGLTQNTVDVTRKIRGKSDQDISGLTPAQQFCAYHSTRGSAGLHRLQHKIQNSILGGSLECTLTKGLNEQSPEGPNADPKAQSKGQALSDPIPPAVGSVIDDPIASQPVGGETNNATPATK